MPGAGLRVVLAGTVLFLASCAGGTPECGSGDVKDNLKSIAEDRLAQLANTETAKVLTSFPGAVHDRVSYEFTSIRTVAHDEDVDTYQCSSTLRVALDGGKNGNWEGGFDYAVYGVKNGDSDFEVEYDPANLANLGWAAGKIHEELVWEFNRERQVRDWSKELQVARDAGGAWSMTEQELVGFIRNKKGEIPDVTPEQRQKAIESMLKLEDPSQVFKNVPEDVLAEVRRLREQGAGVQGAASPGQEDEAIEDGPNGDVVVDN